MTELDVLECFSSDRLEMTAGDVIRVSGIPRSTAFRFLKRLVDRGYLSKHPVTSAYRLGPRVLELGLLARAALGSDESVSAALRRLHDLTGETVVYSVVDGLERVCVQVIEATSGLRNVVSVGDRYPLDQGAAGHAILARFTDARIWEVLERAGLQGAALEAKRKAIEKGRDEGVAVTTGDRVRGATAVAAPVVVAGAVLGSVTVTGPSDRMAPVLSVATDGVVRAARDLSRSFAEVARSHDTGEPAVVVRSSGKEL